MGQVKKTMKKIGRHIWEAFKGSIPSALMYFCAGSILMMLTMKGEEAYAWDNKKLAWSIVCGLAAVAYNLFVSYAQGGNAYEMLVSGNMKRVSAEQYGEGFKISTHKEAKEYRVWKGFAIGGFCALFTLLAGVFMGANQARVNSVFQKGNSWGVGFGLGVIACFLLSGWSVLPFFYLNASGVAISYFVSCAFALIPVAATGGMYIAGAYGRRNKNVRQQELADRAARAEANKPKKINYGGLPGTKPKKRK